MCIVCVFVCVCVVCMCICWSKNEERTKDEWIYLPFWYQEDTDGFWWWAWKEIYPTPSSATRNHRALYAAHISIKNRIQGPPPTKGDIPSWCQTAEWDHTLFFLPPSGEMTYYFSLALFLCVTTVVIWNSNNQHDSLTDPCCCLMTVVAATPCLSSCGSQMGTGGPHGTWGTSWVLC